MSGTTTFVFSYTPTFTDQQTVELLNSKLDDIMKRNPNSAESLYIQMNEVYVSIDTSKVDQWKIFVLWEMMLHIEQTYINPPPKYDFNDDTSLTKFVTRWVGYDYLQYVPDDLEILYSSDTISISYSLNSYHTVSKRILPDLKELAAAYTERFWTPLQINSGWRSYEYQRDGFSQQCRDSNICAYPWYSEHQSGLAVDFGNMYSDQYKWMANNAHLYGFHQSYQNGFDIDHYHREDRHWRYLGVEFATELYNEEETFTERYEGRELVSG